MADGRLGRLIELADTSAWTNRQKDRGVAADFNGRVERGEIATCEIVVLELLWSARDPEQFSLRRRRLEALELVAIDSAAWRRATDVFEELSRRRPLHHRQVALPDLLVAAAAELAGIPVCHYDRHFELIAEVTRQPVRAIAPPGSLP
jgi:predicted nucleic acid-binding protein